MSLRKLTYVTKSNIGANAAVSTDVVPTRQAHRFVVLELSHDGAAARDVNLFLRENSTGSQVQFGRFAALPSGQTWIPIAPGRKGYDVTADWRIRAESTLQAGETLTLRAAYIILHAAEAE